MNWDQFKDPLFYLCLAGCVVTSWWLNKEVVGKTSKFRIQKLVKITLHHRFMYSLTEEVAVSNDPFTYIFHRIQWNHLRKNQLCDRLFTKVRNIFRKTAPILHKPTKQKRPLLQLCWCNWILALLHLWQILISGFFYLGKAVDDGCIKNGRPFVNNCRLWLLVMNVIIVWPADI